VNKCMTVKTEGRIDPQVFASARRINSSSVRMCGVFVLELADITK
jgi:hypothetical protein